VSRHELDAAARAQLLEKLKLAAYPRSATYPVEWPLEHTMGPNVLWLTEALAETMDLQAGMRVLDLGCGMALSSIFLARELGVEVWATDLWIPATENWRRIQEAGLEGRVHPIYAEARALPFAEGFFDAAVSLDAYYYFGTDDLYLGRHLAPVVRPDGQLGIVVPGLTAEWTDGPPAHLARHWQPPSWNNWAFHSPAWWSDLWGKTGLVDVEVADLLPDGWKHWLAWDEATLDLGYIPSDVVPAAFADWLPDWMGSVREDAGRNLGLVRLVAHRRGDARSYV
jgi:SAM-dependent methyltransferase